MAWHKNKMDMPKDKTILAVVECKVWLARWKDFDRCFVVRPENGEVIEFIDIPRYIREEAFTHWANLPALPSDRYGRKK